MANKPIKYDVTQNEERLVVIWEHISNTGIKRIETAIVGINDKMDNLKHIQKALDCHFGESHGHSTIQVKPAFTVTFEEEEKG